MLKIKIQRNVFLKAIQIVEKAVRENKIRPVISGIELEAKGKLITLKGTDLELTIKTTIDGEVIEEGKTVFAYNLIVEYLKEVDKEEILIEEQEGKLIISTKIAVSEFQIYDAEEYPVIREIESGKEIFINKDLFVNSLEKTKMAAAQTSDNLSVHCVRMEIKNRILKIVSSDTYRLAYCEAELGEEAGFDTEIKVSIPLKTIDSMVKILKNIDGTMINVRYEGTQIFFRIAEVSILSRVIDLEFPDYESILSNTQYNKKVVLNTKDYTSLLKRVLVFVRSNIDSKNSAIFSFIGNKLIIKGISKSAKIKEEIDTIKDGDDLNISLNVKFLIDYLQNLETTNIEMNLTDSSSAVLLKGENEEKYIYFTMPLALLED
ncbi:MAG: DNA polymerase III subunit beta [Fusobacteria bacterium]|nr:DNA polymerase III subunit beta [Fusobacteriota bacterium]